jgi:hypothetical protein
MPDAPARSDRSPAGSQADGHSPDAAVSKWQPGERTLNAIVADLSKPIPPRLLDSKTKGGATLTFVPWYRAKKLLDFYAPGWSKRIEITHAGEGKLARLYVTCEITIIASDGAYTRAATGTETLDTDTFGDPSSNAESMAFRRAAAQFGLGLYLYEG